MKIIILKLQNVAKKLIKIYKLKHCPCCGADLPLNNPLLKSNIKE